MTTYLRIGPTGGAGPELSCCPIDPTWTGCALPTNTGNPPSSFANARINRIDLVSVNNQSPNYAPGAVYGFTLYWGNVGTNAALGSITFGGALDPNDPATGHTDTLSFFIPPGDFLTGLSGIALRSAALPTEIGAFALYDGLYQLRFHSMGGTSLTMGSGDILYKGDYGVTTNWNPTNPSFSLHYSFFLTAPTGYHVIGLMAHQGGLIDGVGLICAPLPVGV